MEKIIWTPDLYGGCDFKVYLDKEFAKEMIQSKIPNGKQIRMNELANEELKRLRINWSNPYSFYTDSCFITQFYIGQDGVWLSTNYQTIEDLINRKESSKIVEYNSHNVDTPSQAYVLMVSFDKWVQYADELKRV